MILLDTNVVIALINATSADVRKTFNVRVDQRATIAVGSIVLHELEFGVAKSQRQRANRDLLQAFLAGPVNVLAFDDEDAAVAAALRAELETRGTPIGPYDVLIAGQALRHKATLVTANTREFKRVKGLKVENWGR